MCNGVEGATRSSEPECWGSWEEPEQRTSESCRVNTDPEWQAEEQRLGAMGSEVTVLLMLTPHHEAS